MIETASIVQFSSTISLGVIVLTVISVLSAGWATLRTQSIIALRAANDELRKDRDDWRERYHASQVDLADEKARHQEEIDRFSQKVIDLTANCSVLSVEIAKLQALTDTSKLAKSDVLDSFREEVRAAIKHQEDSEQQKFDLIKEQNNTIKDLVLQLTHTEAK
jgi:sigma54-dependent transcription regulator